MSSVNVNIDIINYYWHSYYLCRILCESLCIFPGNIVVLVSVLGLPSSSWSWSRMHCLITSLFNSKCISPSTVWKPVYSQSSLLFSHKHS